MQEDKAIVVRGLSKAYKTYKRSQGLLAAAKSLLRRVPVLTCAVEDVSFEIAEGEIVGFVGQNGAGKSTTIKMLSGIIHPSGGEARVLGYVPWKERTEYVRHIGVVFGQKTQLWLDLPAIDAFYLNKGIYAIPDAEFQHRLSLLLSLLGIEEVVQRPTRNLSLGERMKCEFAMALLHNPRILFLDEPTIGVDALAKEDIREFLLRINRELKTTILLTTHDMDDIEELCRRVIIIDEGKLLYDGDLRSVKERYVKWRTVDVEFKRVTDKETFEKVLAKGRLQADRKWFKSVRFDRTEVDVPLMVRRLMESCEVVDLSVHEPRLEHVIKEIYKERKG